MIAWNALYYKESKGIEIDIPCIEALLAQTGPRSEDMLEALSWHKRRSRLLYLLGDLLPFLIPLIPSPAIKNTIGETLRYFENHNNVASEVRELLKAPLRESLRKGERILLIGHSMGSVIAYDALWELWHEENNRSQIDLLLTLGSPLGMRFVQKRLIGFRDRDGRRFPGNIRHWVNVATEGDVTALDPTLHDDFKPMIARGHTVAIEDLHQGIFGYFRDRAGVLNVHRSYGYLVQPTVGKAIAAWWRGLPVGASAPSMTEDPERASVYPT